MPKSSVTTTIEVLGKKLTREEAEALYYELKRELKMQEVPTTVPVPYPVYPPVRRPWEYYPERTYCASVTKPESAGGIVDISTKASLNCQ